MRTDNVRWRDRYQLLLSVSVTAVVLVFTLPAEAAPRKPKYQEPASEITAQVLEQQLANEVSLGLDVSQTSLALARTYYKLREFNSEAEVLEDALATGIADTNLAGQAHYYLGRTYQALGTGDQAETEFLTVWNQYPGCEFRLNAAIEIGNLMLLASNTVDATQWYETVRDLEPTSRIAFLARDKLRAMTKGKSLAEIADGSPSRVFKSDLFIRLDQCLYSQMYSNADAVAQQLVSSATNAPELAAMNFRLAHDYWMYGNVEGASQFITNSLQTTGERHVQALILAGHVARSLWQTNAALGYYQQAIAAAPNKEMTITAYQQAIRLLYLSGQQGNALALAASGKQAFSGKPQLVAYLDRIKSTLRDRADPHWKDYAAQVAATSTADIGRQALMQLANDARLHSDWAGAGQLYGQLVSRPSKGWRSNVDMELRLLDVQLRQTDTVAAAASVNTLTNRIPQLSTDDAKAYTLYRLGKIQESNGQTNNAQAEWQQVLKQFPQTTVYGMAQVHLAKLYESQGDLTNAVSMYQAYLQNSEVALRYRLRAYASLFRVENALGAPDSAISMLQNAQATALQTKDAELELSLAQYFLHNNDTNVANQFLDAGITNAEAAIQAEPSAQKRLWWEYLIIRRLDDFQRYQQLGDRAATIDPALLQNPLLNTSMRLAAHCYLMRALEVSGRWTSAEALCQRAV